MTDNIEYFALRPKYVVKTQEFLRGLRKIKDHDHMALPEARLSEADQLKLRNPKYKKEKGILPEKKAMNTSMTPGTKVG